MALSSPLCTASDEEMSRSGGLEEGGESSSSPTVGLGFRDVQIEPVHRPSPHGGAPSSEAQSCFDKDCRIRPTAAKPRPSTRRPRPSARPGGKAESGLFPDKDVYLARRHRKAGVGLRFPTSPPQLAKPTPPYSFPPPRPALSPPVTFTVYPPAPPPPLGPAV